MRKILSLLVSRLLITIILILIQFTILVAGLLFLQRDYLYWSFLFSIASIILLVSIVNNSMSASAKLPWVVLTLIFPFTALALFLIIANNRSQRHFSKYIKKSNESFDELIERNEGLKQRMVSEHKSISMTMDYIENMTHLTPQDETNVTYFEIGEKMFDAMKEDIKQAKHFVYLEFFIIHSGQMWDELKSLLIDKAKAGLDVRLIYDDMGCMGMIPYNTYKELEKQGVKVERFNPFRAILSVQHNARDHRKICVIDGYIGYTGGLNISDEYINVTHPLGHWKDTGIRMEGKATYQLTLIFLQTWNYYRKDTSDLKAYDPVHFMTSKVASNGVVQCFGESPLDHELLAQTLYMSILNRAKDYVYIYSPYFIVDSEMVFAFTMAAKRGVDVRLILPHVPDKWYVHLEAQSSYQHLIEAGVKIYEYKPGFMHAKSFVSDDCIAVIGTVNLDYRSLYHHFENAVLLYGCDAIKDMKDDFIETMNASLLMDVKTYKHLPIYKRFIGSLIKFFAPLM